MIVIYFIFFLILFFLNFKRNEFNSSSFLIFIYLLSSFFAIILLKCYNTYDEKYIKLSSIIYHIIVLSLFLIPIVKIGNSGITKFSFLEHSKMKFLAYFIITFSFISIITSINDIIEVIKIGDFGMARMLHNSGDLEQENSSFFVFLGRIGCRMSLFAIFLFFYFYTYDKKSKVLNVLLFISTFSFIFQNLAVAGRDAIVRWFLEVIFVYLFFSNSIEDFKKKKIKKFLWIASIPSLFLFYLISVGRFLGRDYSVLYYIIDYLGQPFIYFSYGFDRFFDPTFYGKLVFPYLFPASQKIAETNLNDVVSADYYLNTFPTFVGSLYLDLGFYLTLGIAMLFCAVLFFTFKKKKFSFLNLLFFLFFYEIAILGVFYYMHASSTAVKSFILICFLSIILKLITNKRNNIQ